MISSIPAFAQKIITWFNKHGRKDLPWQHRPSPYRVWVSEIMLQQTQVTTVIPYFEKFMAKFPDCRALAQASLDEVLHLWTGLGYYARARNLHKAANIILQDFQGEFPSRFEDVVNLPGIGRSTAGAILAFSKHQSFPILDGNVKRVLSRVFAVAGFSGNKQVEDQLWKISEEVTPQKNIHLYTQAIMDLGATLCTRARPNCAECPLQKECLAFSQGRVLEFPNPKPKTQKPNRKARLLIMMRSRKAKQKIQHEVLLEKRPAKGIWGGLWSFPELPPNAKTEKLSVFCKKEFGLKFMGFQALPKFKHTFTHFNLEIEPILIEISTGPLGKTQKLLKRKEKQDSLLEWQALQEACPKGLPSPIKRLLKNLSAHEYPNTSLIATPYTTKNKKAQRRISTVSKKRRLIKK
jgi:A/G-specific adenine glycosylase